MMSIDFYHWYTNGGPSPRADNFGVWLFALIAKADSLNMHRLSAMWPAHVDLWEHMMDNPNLQLPAIVTCDFIARKMREWGIADA